MNPLARLILPALRWRPRTGFRHEQRRIEATLDLGVGGYILFGGNAAAVRDLTRDVASATPHRLLFASDLERGAGQQFPDLTHLPPPAALGFIGRADITARCADVTAAEARSVGLNWVYAPVADLDIEAENPIVQTRSFGDDPARVSEHVAAWVRAAEAHGIATSAKHYPGHGRTTADSHATLPVVDASRDALNADLEPFGAAVRAGTKSVMTAHVAYPAWDASALPASLSAPVLRHLRAELGFDGVIVSDALIMEGILRGRGSSGAVVQAVAAGVDALLYPRDALAAARALERAAPDQLPRARVDDALARVARLADAVAAAPTPGAHPPEPNTAEHAAFADAVADLAVHLLRGEQMSLGEPLDIAIVDDDVGGPYQVGRRDLFAQALEDAGLALGPGGSRIVLVYAEPRSWKSRASLGASSVAALARLLPRASLVALFGHPRLMAQIGGDVPVVCAWHGQPLMQRAAARWVVGQLREGR